MKFRHIILVISILAILTQGSCKKDELLTDTGATLEFSDDTLLFDTVFATLGSVTKNMRVFNTYDQPLKITSIKLAGGAQSNFRLNVNGVAGTEFHDLTIRAGDSIWIFAEVTIDPNQQLLPYVLHDSVVFETNGNIQDVDLVAWGQNAHFIVANKSLGINSNSLKYALLDTNLHAQITWDSILPYVVYGGYAVIDSTQTLTMQPGTKVYFSNGSGLWVYKDGTLKVKGTKDAPVTFQGTRLDGNYKEEPGQWDRIWINDGGNNEIDYAIIKNAFVGIQTEVISEPVLAQKLTLSNTIIRNMSGMGILARNSDITAYNCIVSNCGQYCAALTIGGSYSFTHCTFADYWRLSQRGTPAVHLDNYYTNSADQAVGVALTKADFFNNIIYGNGDNELEVDTVISAASNYTFKNLLVKADYKHLTNNANFTAITRNQDPLFNDSYYNDYTLKTGSPAIDAGDPAYAVGGAATDIFGKPRVTPDLGAIEK